MKFCTDIETRCPDCPIDKYERQLRPEEILALKRMAAMSIVEADDATGKDKEVHIGAISDALNAEEPATWHIVGLARDVAVHRAIGECANHEGAIIDDFIPNQRDASETNRILEKFKLI
jgi:hypothetical protein